MDYEKKLIAYQNKYPHISDVAEKAKKRVPHVAWEYLDSGTGDENINPKTKF